MRILVVDDETVALSSVRRLLKRKGHQNVDICDNGKEAISRIRSKDYDVAIIDLLMPGIDGLQVIEAAKALCAVNGIHHADSRGGCVGCI